MNDAVEAGSGGLFGTIVNLVNIGFAGVGVAVLLLLFVILMRDKPVNSGSQKLRNRFLTWGMSFAFFCGILAVVGPLLAPRPVGSAPNMILSFSPKFETEGLPAPGITLPDGVIVAPGKAFAAQQGQVLVSVDDALKSIATLKETALTLAKANAAAQDQADKAVAKLTQSQGAVTPPVAATQSQAEDASRTSQAASADIAKAIRAGNFAQLRKQTSSIEQAGKISEVARAKIVRAY